MRKAILFSLAVRPAGMRLADIAPNRMKRLVAWFAVAWMSSEGLITAHEASVQNPLDLPDVYWRITDKGRWFLSR